MSNFSRFMKQNKVQKQNVFKAVTKSLCDEDGKPLQWELQPISTKMNDSIRESCTTEIPVKGKPNQFRMKVDMVAYQARLMCASVVYPDLNDKELQDSYGVMTPEDLLKEMVDDAGEYTELMSFVQEISGFTTLQEDIEEVKN